ncbi:MAG: hypothetical protein PHE79_04810 [Eubacteriales bacterium]|nr:hypothetical protein [Eubacteriales bacterium]
MDRISKLKALSPTPANAEVDIGLINQYSVKTLSPEDVFCFSVILCDNEVDRDIERFTNSSLGKLAPMFLGKSGLFDHRWSAEKQTARLYRTELVDLEGKTLLGEQKKGIRGSAYMLKTETTAPVIEAIEGGILKEVSVGCAMGKCTCSICGGKFRYSWELGKRICENEHIIGMEYDGKACVGDLNDPTDAYEFSFVAVPSQRGAGVTKGAEDISELVETMKAADLSKANPEELKTIIQKSQMALTDNDEREKRAKILAENQKFMEVKKNDII